MHRNRKIEIALYLMFEAQQSDCCVSSNSPIANIHIEKEPQIDMRTIKIGGKIHKKFCRQHWTKRYKSTKTINRASLGSGGISKIEYSPILMELNSIYRTFPPEYKNMLKYYIFNNGWTYEALAEKYQLSEDQIKRIFKNMYQEFSKVDIAHF